MFQTNRKEAQKGQRSKAGTQKIFNRKERTEGTKILNREIRGIHEKAKRGEGTGNSLKGFLTGNLRGNDRF